MKLETSFYRVVQNVFRYLEPFRRGPRGPDRQTDGRTNRTGVSISAAERPAPISACCDCWDVFVAAVVDTVHSPAHSQRHKTVPVLLLRQTLPPEVRHEEAHLHPYR